MYRHVCFTREKQFQIPSLIGERDLGLVQDADVAVDLLQLPQELRVLRARPPVSVVHVLQLQVSLRHPLVELVELALQRFVRLLRGCLKRLWSVQSRVYVVNSKNFKTRQGAILWCECDVSRSRRVRYGIGASLVENVAT